MRSWSIYSFAAGTGREVRIDDGTTAIPFSLMSSLGHGGMSRVSGWNDAVESLKEAVDLSLLARLARLEMAYLIVHAL